MPCVCDDQKLSDKSHSIWKTEGIGLVQGVRLAFGKLNAFDFMIERVRDVGALSLGDESHWVP